MYGSLRAQPAYRPQGAFGSPGRIPIARSREVRRAGLPGCLPRASLTGRGITPSPGSPPRRSSTRRRRSTSRRSTPRLRPSACRRSSTYHRPSTCLRPSCPRSPPRPRRPPPPLRRVSSSTRPGATSSRGRRSGDALHLGVDSQSAAGAARRAALVSRRAARGSGRAGHTEPDLSMDRRRGHDVLDEPRGEHPGAASLTGAEAGPGHRAAVARSGVLTPTPRRQRGSPRTRGTGPPTGPAPSTPRCPDRGAARS